MSEVEPQVTEVRAIKLGTKVEDYDKLLRILRKRKASWTVHFETDSFLLDPDTATTVQKAIETEDVTDTYRDLKQRTSGFQVLRIVGELEVAPGEKIRGPERIIRDYASGTYILIDYLGRQHDMNLQTARDRLCSGSFEQAPSVGEKPIILETIEEAKQAFL